MSQSLRVAISLCAMALLAFPAVGAESPEPDDDRFTPTFTNASIEEVLLDYSEMTGLTMLFHPGVPRGTISVTNAAPLSLSQYGRIIGGKVEANRAALVPVGSRFVQVLPAILAQTAATNLDALAPFTSAQTNQPAEEGGQLYSMRFHSAPVGVFLQDYGERAGAKVKPNHNLQHTTITCFSRDLSRSEHLQVIEAVLRMHGIRLARLDERTIAAIPLSTAEKDVPGILAGMAKEP